jgi:MiaB-like tRNA modifying enzyme
MVWKVYIETYGCTSNQADSDIMRGIIKRYFALSEEIEDSDVVIINSCGVVEFTERKIIKRAKELRKSGKKVILAGCLPRIAKNSSNIADSILTPDNIDKVATVVDLTMKGKNVALTDRMKIDKSDFRCLKERLKTNCIAIVSISEGCLGECSYCATRFARGRLNSFKIDNIINEIKIAVSEGFREIQLTSQDTAAYGLDSGTNLSKLLSRISEIDGEFRVRVGMMNPNHAIEILDDLVEAFKSEKIYKFLHLPVQSGDNRILEDMKRGYTVEDFLEVVSRFRKEFDDIVLSTDVIVGYPTEGEESFIKTYELIRYVKPDIVNITRFSPRKGTPAAKLKDIPDWIKKERSRRLTKLAKDIGEINNSRHISKTYRILVTKEGKNQTYTGRTNSYRPVILEKAVLGEFYKVKITDYTFNFLRGEILGSN